MKLISIFILLFITCLDAQAQTQIQAIKDSLIITKLIGYEEKASLGDYDIKFKNVITDSRCPKSVMCHRAGEADVMVSIFTNGRFVKDKKIRIDASGYVMESNNLAFEGKDFKIYVVALKPYPDKANSILEKDYSLEIVFKPKS